MLDQAWLTTQFCSPKKLRTSQAFWALTWFCSSDAEEMWGEKEKWMKITVCDLSLWNLSVIWLLLLLFKCEFVPDTNPSNSAGHTSDTRWAPKDWRGSFDVGNKNMVWNVRGELSSHLTSTPFSWPSSCAICVLICARELQTLERRKQINPKCGAWTAVRWITYKWAWNLSAPSLCPASRTKRK